MGKQRSYYKRLHERHRKYVWSDINKCSPPVAVTAGIAGANLISQGEVSLVVWERGVLGMHDCKHALYPNQVSPPRLISPRKLVTNPRQRVGRGGRTKEKSCHERTGWWWWWQWWWMKRVCPLAVPVAYLSPTPLNVSPPLVFFLSLRGYLRYTPYCIPSQLYVCTSTLRKFSTTAVILMLHNRQRSFQKKTLK